MSISLEGQVSFLESPPHSPVGVSVVVGSVGLVLLVPVVVLVGVALLLGAGQPVHQVVGRLVRDVGEQAVHQVLVALQLVLDRVTGKEGREGRRVSSACLRKLLYFTGQLMKCCF